MLSSITYSKSFFQLKSIKLMILLLIFLCGNRLSAQTTDTSSVSKHSPKKATIMSACLPGLGQAYNKKYWKIPIIYAGAAGVVYAVMFNGKNYRTYKKAYLYRTDGDSLTIDNYNYSTESLLLLKNFYRRNLELSYIVGGVIYALNVIDATVDAHLFNFDIKDDISLKVDPIMMTSQNHSYAGLSFSFTFGKNSKQ